MRFSLRPWPGRVLQCLLAFPAPRSPCGPYPARPANARSPHAAWRSPAPPGPPAADRPAWPGPPTRPDRAAAATPTPATCTSPPGAAERPCRPCPDRRTPPRSAPCTPRSTSASAPSPAPQDQAPGHSNSLGMAPRSPSQDKVSNSNPASPDLDREGSGSYPTGTQVSDEEMATLPIIRHDFHGDWNYTLHPPPHSAANAQDVSVGTVDSVDSVA